MLSSTSCRRPLLQIPNEHIQIQKEKENVLVACLRPQKEPNLHPRMECQTGSVPHFGAV